METMQIKQVAADTGAAISAAGAGASWIVAANDILQLVVHVVAIAAGVAAAYYHIKRSRKL